MLNYVEAVGSLDFPECKK